MKIAEATILVVDDEPIVNLTMSLLLQQTGATVLRAENGAEAFEHLTRTAVDVMICDGNMPVMDGMTLLNILHADGRTVPTLLFVSGMGQEDATVLQPVGVRRLLTKPIQPAALLAAVSAVLADIPAR